MGMFLQVLVRKLNILQKVWCEELSDNNYHNATYTCYKVIYIVCALDWPTYDDAVRMQCGKSLDRIYFFAGLPWNVVLLLK